jgi:hypothetical protein
VSRNTRVVVAGTGAAGGEVAVHVSRAHYGEPPVILAAD